MNIAVLCPSEIAFRRFMPALQTNSLFSFAGIGTASPEEWFGASIRQKTSAEIGEQQKREQEKAETFIRLFGGKRFPSYEKLILSPDVDAIYIPLPPGLHFYWADMALKAGKHVFVEKPATTTLADTQILIESARCRKLALHENYMFIFHQQLDEIERIVQSGEIGEVRLFRISFGFPRRAENDFRYQKELGGGALLDCGGYTIRYAVRLLGTSARLVTAQSNYQKGIPVDLYGSATMINDTGTTVQLAFGMDNQYKCELEVWGSTGTLATGRVLTAPAGFTPTLEIRKQNETTIRPLPSDDTFGKSILHFKKCIEDPQIRTDQYSIIEKQAALVERFRILASENIC